MEKEIKFDNKANLGHGSYGTEVYKGKCDGKDVAVKVIPMLGSGKKRFYNEYQRLIQITNSGECEYIVKCHGFDLSNHHYVYIALELCDSSLMNHDLSDDTLNCDDKIDMCRQLTSGVAYLHSKEIIHGDLTPTNVLIKKHGSKIVIKIADFGMSKNLPERGQELLGTSSGNCTTEWMAPEILRRLQNGKVKNLEANCATDIFSLGCLKFFIITGGLHIFGEVFFREVNILQKRPNFQLASIKKNLFSIACLIFYEISHDPSDRPSSADILRSPLLWDKALDQQFLMAVQAWSRVSSSNEYKHAILIVKEKMHKYLELVKNQNKSENVHQFKALREEISRCDLEFIEQLILLKFGHDMAGISHRTKISDIFRAFWLNENFKVLKYIIFQAFHPLLEISILKKFYSAWTFKDDMIDVLNKCSHEHMDPMDISDVQESSEDEMMTLPAKKSLEKGVHKKESAQGIEAGQREHIIRNLPELIETTEFNAYVKHKLLAYGILTKTDVEILDAERHRFGKTAASYKCYDILMTRTGAYKRLLKALEENKQTRAANILRNGLQYFGVSVDLNKFKETEIVAQGTKIKLNDFFPPDKLEQALKIFQDTIPEQKLIDWFVDKQETFVLAKSTIPPELPLYISRFLSNRIEINETAFKADSPDIFVFRNTIERWKLSEIAKPNFTSSSNYQLDQITCRFIHLDEYEDWVELKQKAKVPIHLINYDPDQHTYILEESSGTLKILSRISSKTQRPYLSEQQFVQQQLSEDLKVSIVYICDKPGMGKTYLLANIARLITKHLTGSIVAFIQLSTFVADLTTLLSSDPTKKQDISILDVFKYVSLFPGHAELLTKLVEADILRAEIFFDGFDEIPSEIVERMKQMILGIKSKLPKVRIYITSRHHMRQELEKILGVIAYDILPFNLENQVDYLVHFWSLTYPELDNTPVRKFALNCLKKINTTLSKSDKEMAGIPLLCQLITEVFSKQVRRYVTANVENVDFPLKLAPMYQHFIQQRIEASTKNEDEFINIKLLHICHALKLLFPNDSFQNDGVFDRVHQLDFSSQLEVLKAGIMHLESNSKLEFIHRTFADYFVAEYFSKKLQSTTKKPKVCLDSEADESQQVLLSILNQLLSITDEDESGITFVNSVIVSFVDFNLNEDRISEETTSTVAVFCAALSPENLFSILCSCCQHNLLSLLFVLKEALRKWDWEQKNKYFTTKNCFNLLSLCISRSTSQMLHSCIQLFTEVLELDVEQIASYDKENTLLHIAAHCGNYEALEFLIDRVSLELSGVLKTCVSGSSHDDMDKIRRKENILQLLHYKQRALVSTNSIILATEEIHVKLLKSLVQLGANLNVVDSYGKNCVFNATLHMSPINFHELVNFILIDCKAEYLFLPQDKWRNPLATIIQNVDLMTETMKLLFSIPGIALNRMDEGGKNLLFNAVTGRKLRNLEQLVNFGQDYKHRDKRNRSLLHVAGDLGDGMVVRYLLSLNLDPNSRDDKEWTPLHYAVSNFKYSLSVVQILVENGANVQSKNKDGQTALHISAGKRLNPRLDVLKYLIRKGASVNEHDNDGNTPLHLWSTGEVRNCLIEMGADIHAINKNYQTVLHTTASQLNACCDEIKYLITNGVGVNDRDNDGNTPLHLCEEKKARDCLIEMGADIHATNKNGQTVLHTTVSKENASCDEIKYLITNGVEVNDRDNDGNTPLHLCRIMSNMDCLIEMGADIHATNNNGQTPAQKNSHLWVPFGKATLTSNETDSK